MKLTFGRWVAVIVVVCLALVAAFLPADASTSLQAWFDEASPVDGWELRVEARERHERQVLSQLRLESDVALARRVFATRPGRVGDPEVWFADEIPATTRRAFSEELARERAARPGWKGRGKVGVLVILDTATTVNGHPISMMAPGQRGTSLRSLPASAATGDRCIAVVRLPWPDGSVLSGHDGGISPEHESPLLDSCGFYDAFGPPGAALSRQLREARMEFARGYRPIIISDAMKQSPPFSWLVYGTYGSILTTAGCLVGNDKACLNEFTGWPSGFDASSAHAMLMIKDWPDGSMSEPRGAGNYMSNPLNRMASELGPQRFERVWESAKPLADAYLDESGETLAQFVRRWMVKYFGTYRPGPWTTASSMGLTLIAIATIFGISLKFAPRPSAA